MKRSRLALVSLMLIGSVPALAQEGARDSVVLKLPEVEVTALRGRDRLRDIPAATFVFPRERIKASGASRLSSLLSTLPGLYGYQQNSSGDPAVVDARGFTANGERSYLKMLVNGQDARDIENGGVDWDWISPNDVERLEVVEGGGAWAYGDGSEGGIVNIVRPVPSGGAHPSLAARAGSFGQRMGSVSGSGRRGNLTAGVRGAARLVDGWRDRSRERVYTAGGELDWQRSERNRVSFDAAWIDADRQDPGTLTPEELAIERTRAETRTDFNRGKRLLLGAHYHSGNPTASGWTVSPYFRAEVVDQIRTLFTQTPAVQSKLHPSRSWTEGIEGVWCRPLRFAGRDLALTAGSQLEQSKLRSSYFDYDGGVGPLRTRVESRRLTGSAWADAKLALDSHTTARLGFRQDAVRLRSESLTDTTEVPARTLWSGSPFVAVSRGFGEQISAYVSYSAAFRVPSLNQLFDPRPIDFFGQTFTLSRPDLRPQRAHNLELGGRWDAADGTSALLTLYGIWVRNEIDFDAATFAYANLDKSLHRGAQVALTRPIGWDLSATMNGTWSPTTLRGGPNDGNQINAVPRGTAYGSIAWTPHPGWSLEGGVRWVGRQFLDKANEHPLGEFTTVELGSSVKLDRVRATLRVGNLFQRDYSDTGYLLDLGPLGVQERFSSAAPRSITVGLSVD